MAKEVKKQDESLYIKMDKDSLAKHTMDDDTFITRGTPQTQTSTDKALAASTNVITRPGHSREDTYSAREEERLPCGHQDIIKTCQSLYKRNGLIRNLIDLMADFASEGIEIQHTIEAQEQFYKAWARKVNLEMKSHDFMRNFLRDGNVIVHKRMAKPSRTALKQMLAKSDQTVRDIIKINKEKDPFKKFELPWSYTLLNPAIAVKTGGKIAKMFGGDNVGIKLDPHVAAAIKNPKNDEDKALISKLPKEVVSAIRSAESSLSPVVKLDPTRTFVAYYKKDDWDEWGTPFLYGILDEILFKDKMRQADIAALDGVINVIRLWKLGNSEKDILPTRTAVNKLLGILENNVGGGVMDLVWDDMIDLKVEYPPTDKILGDAKYKSVNSDIVRGLGIPDALVGGSDSTTRNSQTAFVQLKTLIQRLEYVRSVCLAWINAELKQVMRAMGWKKPPVIGFGNMSLRDEATEKKLLIQLLDRGMISIETVLNNFGRDFTVELERLKDEENIRKLVKPVIEKANPFYRPDSMLDKQHRQQMELAQVKVNSGGENPNGDQPRSTETDKQPGRPNTPDTEKRKDRTQKIVSSSDYAFNQIMATQLMNRIDEIFDPLLIKTNKRKLKDEEKKNIEDVKWTVLCSLNPLNVGSEADIRKSINSDNTSQIKDIRVIFDNICHNFITKMKESLTVQNRRSLMALAWSVYHTKAEGVYKS